MLAPKTVMGERTHESTWLLLLELYQNLHRQEAFEDTAVGYAVTFEVSPPSWEEPKATTPATPVAAPVPKPKAVAADCCGLSGELSGDNRASFAALLSYADNNRQVTVNAGGLQRMDVACAETFSLLLEELKAAKKNVRIHNANYLLVGLWRSLGIDKIATIEPRKL